MLSARRRKNTMLYNYKYVSLWNINIYIYIHYTHTCFCWHLAFSPSFVILPNQPHQPHQVADGQQGLLVLQQHDGVRCKGLGQGFMAGGGDVPDEPLTAVGGRTAGGFLGMTRHLEKKMEIFEPEISRNWDFLWCKLMIGLDWMKGKSEQEIVLFPWWS